ncbi:MAG: DUF308 domain-containing protein [Hyphomonadaceae bacterium]|mgnify:FL=1|nr:DUF308 domain-containing protein [Hyphomonadaceae bacterium]MDX2275689.1 DUF308 domain-containing protein [Hyphomonadaceae bacterium]
MSDTAAPPAQAPQASPRPGGRLIFMVVGALMIAFGVAAAFAPMLATFAASVWFGAAMLAAGVSGLALLIVDWRAKGFAWRLLWSVVAILGGICLLLHPWPGALALTVILGAALIAQGAIAIGHALAHRTHTSCPWGRMALGGVLAIVLGGLLIWALPHSGMIAPGVFLAINLISFGLSLFAAAPARPAP